VVFSRLRILPGPRNWEESPRTIGKDEEFRETPPPPGVGRTDRRASHVSPKTGRSDVWHNDLPESAGAGWFAWNGNMRGCSAGKPRVHS
jgi:hypothetical protein